MSLKSVKREGENMVCCRGEKEKMPLEEWGVGTGGRGLGKDDRHSPQINFGQ